MQPKVFILTGAIQTGKTTALIKWCEGKNNVQGILTPVIDGKRMFMDIASKEMFAMEADEHEVDVLKVGKFIFSAAAFAKAKEIIVNALHRVAHSLEGEPIKYLIIDEVGPLELRSEGLHDAIVTVLERKIHETIILVVREVLAEKIISFYNLNNATVIEKSQLSIL